MFLALSFDFYVFLWYGVMGCDNMTTGERIKNARKQAGMTQKELAEKLNIPFQNISAWERNDRNPKYETLLRIADALGIHIYQLLFLNDDTRFELQPTDRSTGEKLDKKTLTLSQIIDALGQETVNDAFRKHRLDEALAIIASALGKLNDEGIEVAINRVIELSEIPRYQRDASPALQQQATSASGQSKAPPQADAQDRE